MGQKNEQVVLNRLAANDRTAPELVSQSRRQLFSTVGAVGILGVAAGLRVAALPVLLLVLVGTKPAVAQQPGCVPQLERLPPSDNMHSIARDRPLGANYIELEYAFGCTSGDLEYRTLLNLLRPAELSDFSGVVVVEATHPSNTRPVRSYTARYLGSAGHASVAVNSHTFAVERLLKPANPDRYGEFSVPGSESLESEILQQLALAIKQGELELGNVDAVLLGGYSNTAARVRSYMDYYLSRYVSVYDGFLVFQTAVGTMPGPLPDLDSPVIEVQGERELIATRARNPQGLAYRRADSANYRLYEVPGQPHLDTSKPEYWSFPPSNCGIDNPSTFPMSQPLEVATARLVDWVTTGNAAPRAPRIETDAERRILRDQHGNARGGMPAPQINVPVATLLTVAPNPPAGAGSRCDMIGPQIDFSAAKLQQLYGNHANYLMELERDFDRLLQMGWVLPLHRQLILEPAREIESKFQ